MKEYRKIPRVQNSRITMLNKFTNSKNNKHVINEAIVPGANFIFPILKKVTKSKLNFLIIFCNRSYDFRSYSLTFPN